MNAFGKFLESKVGTWCVLIMATIAAPIAFINVHVGVVVGVFLAWLGLVIPQLNLYRQAQIARHLAGEQEDD